MPKTEIFLAIKHGNSKMAILIELVTTIQWHREKNVTKLGKMACREVWKFKVEVQH